MKIGIDVTPIQSDGSAGGATGVAIELIKGLIKENNIQIVLVCSKENYNYLKNIFNNLVKYKIINNNITWSRKILNLRNIKKETISTKFDLLFCPFSAINYYDKGIPVVSTIHDIQHEYYPQFFTQTELEHRRKFYENIVKLADSVVCVSDYTKQTFCETYNFPIDRAFTVYNAIQNRFIEEDKTILKEFDLLDDQYIVYPANFWEHKNHKLLIMAFSMYTKNNKNAKLVLTGNVLNKQEYYNDIIQKMKLEKNIIITGYLEENQLYSILVHSKGLIYPSLFEGFGIPVVEAMQMHKIIASSNLTSLPEIGCESIFYFNPKKPDDILEGIQYVFDKKIDENIINEYNEKLKEFDNPRMIKKYLELFYDTLNNKYIKKIGNQFNGITGDGWGEKEISLHLEEVENNILEIHFSLPVFINNNQIKLYINNKYIELYNIKGGQVLTVKKILENETCDIIFKVNKTWKPDKYIKNSDNRLLSIKVDKINIFSKNGIIKMM